MARFPPANRLLHLQLLDSVGLFVDLDGIRILEGFRRHLSPGMAFEASGTPQKLASPD